MTRALAATLLILLWAPAAHAHTRTISTGIDHLEIDSTADVISGTVTSPAAKCVRNRTVVVRSHGEEYGRTQSDAAGDWELAEGSFSTPVTIKVLARTIRATSEHLHTCGEHKVRAS